MSNRPLLLRGATVIDPANSINAQMDVLLKDGVIEKVASGIQPEKDWVVENLKGKYVSAGWIDLHAHAAGDLVNSGVEPDRDAGVNTGVTTVVDAGSAGAMNVKALKRYVLDPATTRVILFMNAANAMGSGIKGAYTDLRNMNMNLSLQAIAAFPDLIKGIKLMASVTQVGDNGIEPVRIARKLARLAGLPLMCHIGNAPPVLEDVLGLMDEGDIVTHSYHGKAGGLLDRKGLPIPEAIAARKRGVWIDVGHGRESFSYETFKRCMDAGFGPDSISTDLHAGNIRGCVVDMATTMSKFLALGFSLKEVIDLSTRRPAEILGIPLGTLTPGTIADVTVFGLVDEDAVLRDSGNATMKVSQLIRPVMTVKNGTKVWAS